MNKPLIVRDTGGAGWEKRGNTLWVACPKCRRFFPVSPVMTRPEAPNCICPSCHQQFTLAERASPPAT